MKTSSTSVWEPFARLRRISHSPQFQPVGPISSVGPAGPVGPTRKTDPRMPRRTRGSGFLSKRTEKPCGACDGFTFCMRRTGFVVGCHAPHGILGRTPCAARDSWSGAMRRTGFLARPAEKNDGPTPYARRLMRASRRSHASSTSSRVITSGGRKRRMESPTWFMTRPSARPSSTTCVAMGTSSWAPRMRP